MKTKRVRRSDLPAKLTGRPCSEWTELVLIELARLRPGEALSVKMETDKEARAKSSLPAQACRTGRKRSVWAGICSAVRGATVYYWRDGG